MAKRLEGESFLSKKLGSERIETGQVPIELAESGKYFPIHMEGTLLLVDNPKPRQGWQNLPLEVALVDIQGSVPRRKADKIEELLRLRRAEVHLPTPPMIRRDFAEGEEEQLRQDFGQKTNKELTGLIQHERGRLRASLVGQGPTGLARP